MEKHFPISRRAAVKSSLFGLMAVSMPNILFAKQVDEMDGHDFYGSSCNRYPSIEDNIVAEVVGVSHFNLDKLKVFVESRPELARATWDWAFGDWETAIGAASHTGRRDIIQYLLSKGARPDIFTYAALGSYTVVKSMIEASPGVQRIAGPHGISLLQHVKNGIAQNNDASSEASDLLGYLTAMGDADSAAYINISEEEKQKYLGDYKYGEGDLDGFSIKLNMKKIISLGRLGKGGGALYKIGDNKYMYNGAPSTIISFGQENGKVVSMTVTEPALSLVAKKIS
jgi:hypothetical protein